MVAVLVPTTPSAAAPSEAAASGPGAVALDVRGVEKGYALGEARLAVLKGIDLAIPAGEMCAVMGPSGVGKSTLLNCVAGLEVPDAGSIHLLGRDLGALDDEGRTLVRRRDVGIVYQFFNLVANLTARENVTLPYLIDGARPDAAAVDSMLERVGMSGRAEHLPAQLSGGEMQLVSIARALVRRPGLVLCDEPTGNVNVATGRRIMALLGEVLKDVGSAMLLVTHNPEDAAKADRVVFMKDGVFLPEAMLEGAEVSPAAVHDRLKSLGI
jgi:putative ABC transport system ATP-binding protein